MGLVVVWKRMSIFFKCVMGFVAFHLTVTFGFLVYSTLISGTEEITKFQAWTNVFANILYIITFIFLMRLNRETEKRLEKSHESLKKIYKEMNENYKDLPEELQVVLKLPQPVEFKKSYMTVISHVIGLLVFSYLLFEAIRTLLQQ